jgi:hypothetical protein
MPDVFTLSRVIQGMVCSIIITDPGIFITVQCKRVVPTCIPRICYSLDRPVQRRYKWREGKKEDDKNKNKACSVQKSSPFDGSLVEMEYISQIRITLRIWIDTNS